MSEKPKSDAQTISTGMARIYEETLGQGPGSAKTEISEDMTVTVLSDSLTEAEIALKDHLGDKVRANRRTLQDDMKEQMTELVEETLDREVVCFLSDHSPDPDHAIEALLLKPKT